MGWVGEEWEGLGDSWVLVALWVWVVGIECYDFIVVQILSILKYKG